MLFYNNNISMIQYLHIYLCYVASLQVAIMICIAPVSV